MEKIKSLFMRDYDGDHLVYDEVVKGSEWVINGEGFATVKFDGTCCMIKDKVLYKRYDCKKGKTPPEGFVPAQDPDEITGNCPGWLKVGDGPEDKYHREALKLRLDRKVITKDGTYELCGPKVQGNPEEVPTHILHKHGTVRTNNDVRDFDSIREFLRVVNLEGIVWHHPDGRMVKIKVKDFGLKRHHLRKEE